MIHRSPPLFAHPLVLRERRLMELRRVVSSKASPCTWPPLRFHGATRALLIIPDLDLLSSPRRVRFAHVRRRLDRGNVLQHDVANTGKSDDGTGNVSQNSVMQQEATNEDVDYPLQHQLMARGSRNQHLQAPRPTNEKRNDA